MVVLHPLTEFVSLAESAPAHCSVTTSVGEPCLWEGLGQQNEGDIPREYQIDCLVPTNPLSDRPTYWYEGRCPQTGEGLRLPRTHLAEAIAQRLMQQLAQSPMQASEGKMYGVLIVADATGERFVLKAFSGLLNGRDCIAGWVPPIPGREQVSLSEAITLSALDEIKQEWIALKQLPARQRYLTESTLFEQQLQALSDRQRQRKQQRKQQRQHLCHTLTGDALAHALAHLDDESRQDGIERRRLKQQRDAALLPLKTAIEQADARLRELKQQRKVLSRQLQQQFYDAYSITNFSGETRSLQQLMPGGWLPTGTGDCCAPKLLHYAATHQLTPLAMAEFWWGAPSALGDRVAGQFYGACEERCQPLMGFLLSGLAPSLPLTISEPEPLTICYSDEGLIVVDKPAGLLSVPGRYRHTQDSVLMRLRQQHGDAQLIAVHRLDEDTSGLLLIARDKTVYRQLSQQFHDRQIHKIYEAVLEGAIASDHGTIELPLWGNPAHRPYQTVDWQHGKPSLTQFRVIQRAVGQTRVEFEPLTGRTHQLRVHAADPQGLGLPILGDRLYGNPSTSTRLHLHARELTVIHPISGRSLQLYAKTPF